VAPPRYRHTLPLQNLRSLISLSVARAARLMSHRTLPSLRRRSGTKDQVRVAVGSTMVTA
jgi:hypothetical protein